MQKYWFYLILSTSFLAHAVKAQDDLLTITSNMDFGGPNLNDSVGDRTKSAAKDALSSTMNDVKSQLSAAYQAVRKGGPSTEEVAEHVMNYLQTAIQKDFITQYFKPDPKNDFNVEALQKLLQPVREKVVNLLRTSFLSEGMVALGPDGARYPVVSNKELLTVILDKVSPDFPMKGVLLSLANNKQINAFLMKKIDLFIIQQCLNVYSISTGRALKKDIAQGIPSLLSGAAKGVIAAPVVAVKVGQNLMADYDDAGELSKLSKDDIPLSQEEEEALSHVIQYIEPRLTHFIRGIIQTDYLNKIIDKAMIAATDPMIKAALRAEPVSRLGNLGAIAGGIASYVNVPLGITLAGAGYFTGMYLGHFANHMQQQTKGFVLNQLDIYKKYIGYRLLPITREEYALYHLSDSPSEDLKNLLQEDYAVRQKMNSQSLIWSMIKDLTTALRLDGVVHGASNMAQSAGESLQKLKAYFSQQTTPELLAFAQGRDDIFPTDKDKKHQALRKLVAILSKNEKHLSASDKDFLKEATLYPSYEAFQDNLENLNKTINYLSQKDLQKLNAEKAAKDTQRTQTYKKYTDEIRIIHDFVTEIATYYQHHQMNDHQQFALDWIEVEDAITPLVNSLPVRFLTTLQEITKDPAFVEGYLMQNHNVTDKHYITTMINAYDGHKYQNDLQTHAEALKLLDQDPISEGLSLREKLLLVQKGAHNALQIPNKDDLIRSEKEKLRILFHKTLAHHIAVDLANQFDANKSVIQQLAQNMMNAQNNITVELLIQSMQKDALFMPFRDLVKDLDGRVYLPADINQSYGGGFIKQSVYNEMMKVIENAAREALSLQSLAQKDDFVIVDHPVPEKDTPQPQESSLSKSWFFGGSKAPSPKEEPKQPEAIAPKNASLTLIFDNRPITKLIAYEGSSIESVMLANMVNERLKTMGGSFDLVRNIDDGFMNALYETLSKRRAFHVIAEDDVLFLEKYQGYILQEAQKNGGAIFYSEAGIIQKLREQAKNNQKQALGMQDVQELHEEVDNIIQ